jgi:NAD(P)-dependent dehydrogenase (short-subunit alcohol dehydrogenase family)
MRNLAPDATLDEFVAHSWKTPMEEFTKTYDVNATGVYYTALAFLSLLDQGNQRNGGKGWREGGGVSSQIVTVGSIAAYSRLPGASFAYNSSKAAVTHMCKHLSSYLGKWRIRVNVIAPGSMFGFTCTFLFRCLPLYHSTSDSLQCIHLKCRRRSHMSRTRRRRVALIRR